MDKTVFSPKGRLIALFLSVFFSFIIFGIPFHNLYLKHTKVAKYQFIMLWGGMIIFIIGFFEPLEINFFSFGVFIANLGTVVFFLRIFWWIIEIFLIAFGLAKDGDGLPVKRWFEKRD